MNIHMLSTPLELISMRSLRFLLLTAVMASAAACGGDTKGVTNPPGPLAYIRYVQALPDTGTVDFRAVDIVENLDANNVAYGFVGAYHGVQPGSRHFKVFVDMGSTSIDVVTQVILDTTLTLSAGTYYTVMHTGFVRAANSPKQKIVLLTDSPTAPAPAQFSLRTVLASPGGIAPLDVFATSDTTTALSGSPKYGGLALLTPSAYSSFNTGAMFLRVTQSGTTTPVLSNSVVYPGSAASGVTSAIPGSTIAGSVLTAFVFSRNDTVTANKAVKFTRPTVVYAIDKRP